MLTKTFRYDNLFKLTREKTTRASRKAKNFDNWTVEHIVSELMEIREDTSRKFFKSKRTLSKERTKKNSKREELARRLVLTGIKPRRTASCSVNARFSSVQAQENLERAHFIREFDPGSGWTLAACLTHASRTKHLDFFGLIGYWVADGWVTRG